MAGNSIQPSTTASVRVQVVLLVHSQTKTQVQQHSTQSTQNTALQHKAMQAEHVFFGDEHATAASARHAAATITIAAAAVITCQLQLAAQQQRLPAAHVQQRLSCLALACHQAPQHVQLLLVLVV